MKYYCIVTENVVTTKGTFDTELILDESDQGYEITKEQFDFIKIGKTTLDEIQITNTN